MESTKLNLSLKRSNVCDVEEDDISFETRVVRTMHNHYELISFNSDLVCQHLAADTTLGSGIEITEGTFSQVLPMEDSLRAVPGPSRAAGPSRAGNTIPEPTTSNTAVQIAENTFPEIPDTNLIVALPSTSRAAGPSSFSNITEVSIRDIEEEEVWPELPGSYVPDFSTAITSTPLRDTDEDGPMLIDIGEMRRQILREKEVQMANENNWFQEVREAICSKTRPYSLKLKGRKAVLTRRIGQIKRQREALDQLLNSLKRESRDVDRHIDYLDNFSENFPAFPQ